MTPPAGNRRAADDGATMDTFRIGITPDVMRTDGVPIFGEGPYRLLDDPRIEWEYLDADGPELTADHAARYDALCVMLKRIPAAAVSRADRRLKLIARFGVGYDMIDVPACSAAGVLLTIAPDGVRRPVATAALTFVLALAQKLPTKDRLVREARWDEKLDHVGTGLTGRVLGSIGLGNIGAELFRLARPFEMVHLACDPYVDPKVAEPLGVKLVDLPTLFRESDFLSVNCPLNDETRGLVSERLIRTMKPSAYLINTARGPIVDERGLVRVLQERAIAGAALDVFEVEPTPADNPLIALDNAILTPHTMCFTDECMRRLAESAFGAVRALVEGRVPPYVVDAAALRHPRLAGLRAA